MASMLRRTASGMLKRFHRLTQSVSRNAVDTHVENYIVDDFLKGDYGSAYGVTPAQRAGLVDAMRSVAGNVQSATRMLYHVVLARELLTVPPGVEGDVIECGAFKGASSASLSLACALVKRKLWVCDSFAGLPEGEPDITRQYSHLKLYGRYAAGEYAGSLAEVRGNVQRYGNIGTCEFVVGLFAESLRKIPSKFVFAFVDVDLTSSMKDCIAHIWPRLADEGLIYTDDSCDMEVVRVWFDEAWWQKQLGERAPGYVGSGCGLPVSVNGASLGYAQKIGNVQKSFQKGSWFAGP
jgi:O-methyltransferase